MTSVVYDLYQAMLDNSAMAWDGAKRLGTGAVLLIAGVVMASLAAGAILLCPLIWVAEQYQWHKLKEGGKAK